MTNISPGVYDVTIRNPTENIERIIRLFLKKKITERESILALVKDCYGNDAEITKWTRIR
jgi:hypothetical protein